MVATNVKVYVACTAMLCLKFLASTITQGNNTWKSGGRPPEDVKLFMAKDFKAKQNYGLSVEKDDEILKAREVELRWRRILLNDLESIPFALFVFGGGILAGSNETVHVSAMIMYTAIRFLHTYAYANSLQPYRSMYWGISVACTLVGIANAVVAIL